jgi:cationic peptide transport system ATP-binding protein
MALLDIKNLTLEIATSQGYVKALEKISLTVNAGEIKALVGESGSGKSLIVSTIVGAIPSDWKVTADRMTWQNKDLLDLSSEERQRIMRSDIGVIFQNPISSLDPSVKIGEQLTESIPSHMVNKGWFWQRKQQKSAIATKQLSRVGIHDPAICLSSYPHEISADICQRLMIAMALVREPQLLIADDPTRGMEVSTKNQILELLVALNRSRELSILFVSHDLLAISSMCHTMTVLYCGQTVENGKIKQLRRRPLHPYTQGLMNSAPSFAQNLKAKAPLHALEGTIPPLTHLPIGCRLGPRCPRAQKECVKTPETRYIHGHSYACRFPLHLDIEKTDDTPAES